MQKNNTRILFVIAIIAIVNALGYGIIIPILYSYSHRYGLTDFQNGLLFSIFSVCQFIATPIIGRLSDVYGRKPLLLFSLGGTALSFFMMALAPSSIFLFLARAIDGITAGNLPVASAVISDTTIQKNRARGFAIIGASFGFGFVFGPAISAMTVVYGIHIPFFISGIIAVIAVILTVLLLPETRPDVRKGSEFHHGSLFDMKKLARALFDRDIGKTLAISLLYALCWSMFIYAYQPFAAKALLLTPQQIAINFTVFGLAGLLSQALAVSRLVKVFGEKKVLFGSLVFMTISFILFSSVSSFSMLMIVSLFHAFGNSLVSPLVQALLSKEADELSQGSILGINASYMSIGMIFGPIIGGILATNQIQLPFIGGAVLAFVCAVFAYKILLTSRLHHVAI